MSTAAQAQPASSGKYEVTRPQGKCFASGDPIAPDDKFMAALRETETGFERVDVSLPHWDAFEKQGIIAFWKTTMPRAEAKRKVFVDDEVLCGLFERLADTTEPSKLNFRFVLGLILMRKRMLVYETSRKDDGKEIWSMRFRGREDHLDMLNPQLTEEQVQDVSRQLGEILNEEL